MPRQETFFEQQNGSRKVEVLKSYDRTYAQEAFRNMDERAQRRLWESLNPEAIYAPADLPSLDNPADVNGEAQDFLWDELVDQAREDGSTVSFFVVNEIEGNHNESLYVSHDWPSAEAYAKSRLAPK